MKMNPGQRQARVDALLQMANVAPTYHKRVKALLADDPELAYDVGYLAKAEALAGSQIARYRTP